MEIEIGTVDVKFRSKSSDTAKKLTRNLDPDAQIKGALIKEASIKEVTSRKDVATFLGLPESIYTNNPLYVAPLRLHMKMMMGKVGTPEKHFLLAYVDGQPVARMGIKVHRHPTGQGEKVALHFGFFECKEGYPHAVKALVEFAHKKYPHLQMMGPFHFRMEDPYVGILMEGYDRDPFFLMSYNPTFYGAYLEGAGFKKAMDLFTYQLHSRDTVNVPIISQNAQRATEAGVTIRSLNKSKLESEARIVASIFNDALSKNWGYEEFLEDQIQEMVTLFKLFIDTRVVTIAEFQGKPVGCLIMIPDFNPIIKASQGKLTPALAWRFMTQKKKISRIRGYALGVLKEHHGLGVGSALAHHMFKAGPALGYHDCEISWVLSNNGPMNELSKAMGGKHNKVYRVFEKESLPLPV